MQQQSSTQKRALIASLIGSSIEWFDFFLYGTAAALVFNKLFFVNEDPLIALMLSYLSFGIPFFIRPLGGIIFSHIGDKIGRKKTLVLTLSLMGGATVCIGLLPSYETIGILAPILLILLRIIQGLGIGGEWGGALLLAVEYAPKDKKGFFGSIPQTGVTIGMLLGTAAISFMTMISGDNFVTWGWRVPFILSAVLVFIGLWIRNGLDETPDFKKAKESGNIAKLPIVDTLRYHWKSVLSATGAKVAETGPFYIFSTFIVSYGTLQLKLPHTTVLNAVTIAMLITTIMIPLMGKLSDTIGRKKMYIWGTVAILLYAFPYFFLLNQGTSFSIIIATVIGLGILWAPVTAVLGTLFSEIFSTQVRYTGVTLGYQLGAALAGGTAPMIAVYLMNVYNNSWIPVALYIVLTCCISLIAIAAVSTKQMAENIQNQDIQA
ncbi:MFS transporter [Bacillus cytotoxicus]|uniref:Putative proline/betaine transporter n=1 Tax=Bacillus cytotoxicus TaxID=580165 RepID=A0AAX2CHJ4_9BACI|nr:MULTISPECIES: MFS transporter [Bacillus cereus group]QTR69468.1 MHS family MFS transporter [Bacillus cytotoxicus]QTR82010.1 MHS family MFS transporter [Bacillus cytotoxicus]QTR85748.1 MHS family MFS transporter [Bacillus cytotoxicus]SCL94021.1 MFS transporter, metabolite:H+ symporter (MHS) family protein [Bacillus cytotoxicus]HDR4572501.1 MHS family MFS transporter [Bacillus cytotoxicus]